MKKRQMMIAVNWILLISMILVVVSGMLLKSMPGMVMGITHALSGYVFAIAGVVHCLQHGMLKFKKKKVVTE